MAGGAKVFANGRVCWAESWESMMKHNLQRPPACEQALMDQLSARLPDARPDREEARRRRARARLVRPLEKP